VLDSVAVAKIHDADNTISNASVAHAEKMSKLVRYACG
jgi:hypothetical protein